MRAIKISVVTSLAITIMLIGFFVYQYTVVENQRFISGIEGAGLEVIYYLLITVFFFVIGLVSFIPSISSIFIEKALGNKILPISISIGSIVICLGMVNYLLMPLIFQLRSG
ncbi:hypothetical protein F9R50_24035 [Vibrio parahaemolyticus]|nr:hypothetical protein [Vibrio parahaemolyticus]